MSTHVAGDRAGFFRVAVPVALLAGASLVAARPEQRTCPGGPAGVAVLAPRVAPAPGPRQARPVDDAEQMSMVTQVPGKGPPAGAGDRVEIRYSAASVDGTRVDAPLPPSPASFVLGRGEVIRGWDDGVAGMRVGEKRRLVVPQAFTRAPGRGAHPLGDPRTSTPIVFQVELLAMVPAAKVE